MTNVGARGEDRMNQLFLYLTGAKAGQNDTITVSNVTKIYAAGGMVLKSSGDSAAATITLDATTVNMINLTDVNTGTFYGWILADVK